MVQRQEWAAYSIGKKLNSPKFSRRTNKWIMAIQLRLHPHSFHQEAACSLLPTSHVVFSVASFCGTMSYVNEAPTAGVHSQLNYLGVLAQTSVCLISCASPQETQYGGYLTCCQSHSWPASNPLHGIPQSLCSRAPAGTGTQGTVAPGHHLHLSFDGLPKLSSSPVLPFMVVPL